MPSVPALWGRHWERGGLKHTAGVGNVSRTRDRLWGMTGKGKGTEALVLRLVSRAKRKRLNGSRPKRGWEAGSGGFNGRPTHVQSSPVYRGALSPFIGTTCETWEAGMTLWRNTRVAQP